MVKAAQPLFSLRRKVVIVTGGSGQLGQMYLQVLKNAGAQAISFDRVLTRNWPAKAQVIVDVTRRSSIEAGLKAVEKMYGTPDVLINNAGVDSPPTSESVGRVSFEQFPVSEWDRVLDVNLKGLFLCCQVVGGAMARRGQGSIINIGSLYGITSPDQRIYEFLRTKGKSDFVKPIAYAASKSGVMNLTRYLATYWGSKGVRVNTLVPGGIFNKQDPRFVKAFSAKVPLGRMGTASELAGPLLFLASEASSYVTGTALVVDGGYLSW